MKTVAIVNPVAGFRQARRRWPSLLDRLGTAAPQVQTWWTQGPGHAEFLAAQARRSGFERVLAVGGDGTVFEVANGLWWEAEGSLPSLGIVPFGTSCDYARNFEVGSRVFQKLVQALGESTLNVDLGVFQVANQQGKTVSRVFLNSLGIGFDARVIARCRQQQKIPQYGKLPYYLSGIRELFNLHHFHWQGRIDGQDFKGRSLIFVISLGRYLGGRLMIAPSASPQSRRFQVIWNRPLSRLGLLTILPKIYLGRHLGHPKVQSLLARKLKLAAEPPTPVEAHGEPVGLTPLEVEIFPGTFQVAAEKLRG